MLFKKSILIPLALCLAPLAQAVSDEANLMLEHTETLTKKFDAVENAFANWGGGFITIVSPAMALQGLHSAYVLAAEDAKMSHQFTKEESDLIMQGMQSKGDAGEKANGAIIKKSEAVLSTKIGFVAQGLVEVLKRDIENYLDAMSPKLGPGHDSNIRKLRSRVDTALKQTINSLLR
ncbi:hypothetical protein FQN49_001476 [Arthroderma sp. PD_2]|nr:hypothetical protein FQN49_001476 [Arthroderma sp. PD_2]